MSSYEKINYRIRPAKSIERKMLCEAFRRLSPFGKVDAYRYVGFGSIYFADFSLIYKSLGIKQMISIEKNVNDAKRVEFNKPYKFIDVKFGESNDELVKISWPESVRSIVWLDYDGMLTSDVLKDISFISSQVSSGSMIIVTINVKFSFSGDGPVKELVQNVGAELVDPSLKNKDLAGREGANVCRELIDSRILDTLKDRNGGLPSNAHFKYKQLFNFQYADGVRMLTTGGIVYDNGQETNMLQCGFEQLEYYRPSNESFKIEAPCLTFKEINFLDKNLPIEGAVSEAAIPSGDISNYEKVRRFFPNFVESEL